MNDKEELLRVFIQQKFIEYLPHARYYYRHWEHSGEINDKNPCSHVAHILPVEDNQTKIRKYIMY